MKDVDKKAEESLEPKEEQDIEQVRFVYNRSNYYREILVEGIYGGVTPGLDIHLSLYSQHVNDFVEQVFKVKPDKTLGQEIKRVFAEPQANPTEQIIMREVEVGVTMNVSTAISLIRWLTVQVKDAQKRMNLDTPEGQSNGK